MKKKNNFNFELDIYHKYEDISRDEIIFVKSYNEFHFRLEQKENDNEELMLLFIFDNEVIESFDINLLFDDINLIIPSIIKELIPKEVVKELFYDITTFVNQWQW